LSLIGHHGGRRIASSRRDVFEIALFVDGSAVFIGAQIDAQIDGLAADLAGYFWDWVTTHKCLLWTVTNNVG
jgi:hypothetical protein